jgi:major membrane immunogen (membrane-anchored lipoprotein)
MRAPLVVVVASSLLLVGCGRSAETSSALASPVGPTAVSQVSPTAAESIVEVPFHSELTWEKIPGSDVSLCTHPLPAGKVYLMRNTNRGVAVSTHLGTGEYENHTCVYGTPGAPEGWFADIRWTAANGDVLLATSEFQRWTGTPGQSIAIDNVTFQDGGTGRFRFAEGTGTAYVNAPARTAEYDGTLRYGRKEK